MSLIVFRWMQPLPDIRWLELQVTYTNLSDFSTGLVTSFSFLTGKSSGWPGV